jgi:hypothetical protein
VVATWQSAEGSSRLYQNAVGGDSATITDDVSGTLDIWYGSEAGGGSSVEGEMANLFIYDQPMTQAQAESLHRAVLWTDVLPSGEHYNATSAITITYGYDPLYRRLAIRQARSIRTPTTPWATGRP